MHRNRATKTGVTAARLSPSAEWAWYPVALCSLLVAAGAVLIRHHVPVELRLSPGHHLPAALALALLGCLATLAAVAGTVRERIGLAGLGAVSLAASLSWVLLGTHPYEGPVVLSLADRHGLHQGDLVAVVPALVGLALVGAAFTARNRRPANTRRP